VVGMSGHCEVGPHHQIWHTHVIFRAKTIMTYCFHLR
jgi:hypothetical protein